MSIQHVSVQKLVARVSLGVLAGLSIASVAGGMAASPVRAGTDLFQSLDVSFKPRGDQPAQPGQTTGGASRGNCGSLAARPLAVAIAPKSAVGLTLAERPSFVVQLNGTPGSEATFTLRDERGKTVYQAPVSLAAGSSLVTVSLPKEAPSLAVGANYQWSIAVECPTANAEDTFVAWSQAGGWVQRVSGQPLAAAKTPQESLTVAARYGQQGLWYDAVAEVARLRATYPDSATLQTAWAQLLSSGGLSTEGLQANAR